MCKRWDTPGKIACTKDCNNDWGGTAAYDNCGECAGGNTGKIACADINNDGTVDLRDAIIVLRALSEIKQDADIYSDADINGDEKIGLQEIIYIIQMISAIPKTN
ncbi:MAG: hypothetical protein GY749_28460 [Desulfobacteraceae bacterium]|nr:hypothetical protein [Desulfobacteraceae bacterium]